ncbi:hypothetical protein LCGC14_0145150 [marine sediment metagenome]|uniref:DUF945 domain-containing protein n=1 Tax=marine sediment metagenome TaxID=412755 RepID=A0A0F9Y194_9ZZZZ
MPAQVESMMFAGETPWHREGVYVGDHNLTSEGAIVKAGLDWEVEQVPFYTMELKAHTGPKSDVEFNSPAGSPEIFNAKEVEGLKIVRRVRDKNVYGVFTDAYEPLQNRDAFGFIDSLVETGGVTIHTAGSLQGGKRVWILAKLPNVMEVLRDDIVDKYLLFANSHDGSLAVTALFTPIRVVCCNTLSLALSSRDKARTVKFRHSKNVMEKVEEAKNILGIANQEFEKSLEMYKAFAVKQMNFSKLQSFVEELFPKLEDKEEASTRTQNIRNKVLKLHEDGIGTDIAGVRGTGWGVYNAVVEYADFERGRDSSRLNSAWFGSGAQLKSRAAQLLAAA